MLRFLICTLTCGLAASAAAADLSELEWQLPDHRVMLPFVKQEPIVFVARNQNPTEWAQLKEFWNPSTQKVTDPATGELIERPVVKIKLPLGLTQPPLVPAENPMTVAKWKLGKQLYFETALSSDASVSCASCHDPRSGFTTATKVSTGIRSQLGGMNGPTVINSAYHFLQFWDGRAISLEDQAQGPVQNPVEMFGGEGHAWNDAVKRIRAQGDYNQRFKQVFGHEATRDAIAKAIATYERTVLSGNAVVDRAELAMRDRVEEEGGTKLEVTAADYETVLKEAFAKKDFAAIKALGLDADKDAGKIPAVAKQIDSGRRLFFGKARCNSCHVGDNYSDNDFHNLGIGVGSDGEWPTTVLGRFGSMPTGHKNPEAMGAFKTPGLRALLDTAPYMHDGSEKTLLDVVELYNRGGNANAFLDVKMRDTEAERKYEAERAASRALPPEVKTYGPTQKVIVPLKLNLTDAEKQDLVMFMRALQGDPIAPIVADEEMMPVTKR
jgi:cytochrome c peroxidase